MKLAERVVSAGLHSSCPDTRLMVALASECGLRRAEIAALHTDDLVAGGIVVRGKGGRDRLVWLPGHVREQLEARPAGWVFPGRFSGHVCPDVVYRRVRGATGVRTHRFRHRCASVGYERTGDLLAVRELGDKWAIRALREYREYFNDVLDL